MNCTRLTFCVHSNHTYSAVLCCQLVAEGADIITGGLKHKLAAFSPRRQGYDHGGKSVLNGDCQAGTLVGRSGGGSRRTVRVMNVRAGNNIDMAVPGRSGWSQYSSEGVSNCIAPKSHLQPRLITRSTPKIRTRCMCMRDRIDVGSEGTREWQ